MLHVLLLLLLLLLLDLMCLGQCLHQHLLGLGLGLLSLDQRLLSLLSLLSLDQRLLSLVGHFVVKVEILMVVALARHARHGLQSWVKGARPPSTSPCGHGPQQLLQQLPL